MKRKSTFTFLICKIENEMYILKFLNECPLTRHGIVLIFGKEHTQFSLFCKFFFSSEAASIIVFNYCTIISRMLPLVIVFDNSELIKD